MYHHNIIYILLFPHIAILTNSGAVGFDPWNYDNSIAPRVENDNVGPDPWNYDNSIAPRVENDNDIPLDLRIPSKKKVQSEKFGAGEWFFRRTLAIILKGGQTNKNDDDSVDVSLQMRFDTKKWEILNEYLQSTSAFSEEMFRRSVGYVEESVYRPTLTDKIIMAWSDYVQVFLMEYKVHITWTLGFLGAAAGLIWLWHHMSHKHVLMLLFIMLYLYEVIISYKEAEKQELEKFLSAVNTCKWFFWTSSCEIPQPDPLIFMKHMNPMKIGIRMLTTLLVEPLVAISATVTTMIHGITDGLWFPLDKIVYMLLTVIINISLIFFLIMIIFNYILNIPFNFSFGLMSIAIKQRKRSLFTNPPASPQPNQVEHTDRISAATLDRILDVFSLALNNTTQNSGPTASSQLPISFKRPRIQRSASTGRLPNLNLSLEGNHDQLALNNNVKRRRNVAFEVGSGDG